MTRVCHISPVHNIEDNRILHKECAALSDAGYDVCLVIQNPRNETRGRIEIVALKPTTSRIRRMLFTSWEALAKSLRTGAKIFHFHDPEFIPQALVLRMLGKVVVYDIHEDYVTSLYQKPYLSGGLGHVLGWVMLGVEQMAAKLFHIIIAEQYYARRFKDATCVLNYPVRPKDIPEPQRSEEDLIYTGKVMFDRGVGVHARIPSLVDKVRVHFVGYCPEDVYDAVMLHTTTPGKLEFPFVGSFVPFQEISAAYRQGKWLAGLAIFPKTEHYREKQLTKLFEYMQYGLPIIATDFPVWVELVEGNNCGFCVDPTRDDQIIHAVTRLREDPELWQQLSHAGMVASRRFSWDTQSANLRNLYSKLT